MTVRILIGDCRQVLKTLPDESVQCVVTSPPYFGLRDYGVAGQIGLEPSPDEFVAIMVDVFREVRRVLRSDGTLWLNLGDSYAAGGNGGHQRSGPPGDKQTLEGRRDRKTPSFHGHKDRGIADRIGERRKAPSGLKPKDLIGIPWRVAFALQADGWWLRQDIIWSKPNPMPESVTDRCTKAHEYLFLLSKSQKYRFDAEAMWEPAIAGPPGNTQHRGEAEYDAGDERHRTKKGLVAYADRQRRQRGVTPRHAPYTSSCEQSGLNEVGRGAGRNKRSVWSVATRPFKEAHFATFPPALIEPCILAGCPAGGTVLDPFAGAGTTGLVAARHHRNAILIELNPEYAAMAERRIHGDAPLLQEAAE